MRSPNFMIATLGALVISLFFALPSLAEQTPTYIPSDSRVCADTLYQVAHLPKETSRLEWPKKLKFIGLSWPVWSAVDPSEHLDLIEKAVQWRDARGNNLAASLADYYKAYGSDQQKKSMWENLGKPYYLQLIRSNRLIMQSAIVAFSSESYVPNQPVQGMFVRFRTLPNADEKKDMSIGSSQPEFDDYGWYDSSWHYVIISISNFGAVKNTPISLGGLPLGGELGLVGSELKLFETPGMPAQIDDIYLNVPSTEQNEYTALSVFGICEHK